MINRTRVSKMLGKFRNLPAIDMDKLVNVLLSVSAMACELPWIQEMDINPLIVDENGAVAVDARICCDDPKASTDPYHHLAIHHHGDTGQRGRCFRSCLVSAFLRQGGNV